MRCQVLSKARGGGDIITCEGGERREVTLCEQGGGGWWEEGREKKRTADVNIFMGNGLLEAAGKR